MKTRQAQFGQGDSKQPENGQVTGHRQGQSPRNNTADANQRRVSPNM